MSQYTHTSPGAYVRLRGWSHDLAPPWCWHSGCPAPVRGLLTARRALPRMASVQRWPRDRGGLCFPSGPACPMGGRDFHGRLFLYAYVGSIFSHTNCLMKASHHTSNSHSDSPGEVIKHRQGRGSDALMTPPKSSHRNSTGKKCLSPS
jgi:hypothetical protein